MPKQGGNTSERRVRELLVAARKRAGLTQTQLAQRLGKPQSFVSKYENGERRLLFTELLQVAEHLALDVAELAEKVRDR